MEETEGFKSRLYNKTEQIRDEAQTERVYQWMLREWKRRTTDQYIAGLVAEQERIIADATNQIAKYHEWQAIAPKKVSEYEAFLKLHHERQIVVDHEKTINKILEIQAQMDIYRKKLEGLGINPNSAELE